MQLVRPKNLNSHGLSLPVAIRSLGRAGILNPAVFRRTANNTAKFFSLLISFGALATVPAVAAERVPFITIDQGFRSGVRDRKFSVVKTEAEWKALWQAHVQPQAPAKELPRVDFDKEMVVAVFLGEKSTGGYKVEITAMEEDRGMGQLRIRTREGKPPPGAMTIQALTQPYHIVKLKKIDLPVTFVTEP